MAAEHTEMAAPVPSGSRTITEQIPASSSGGDSSSSQPPVLRLRLQKPRSDKKVQWTNGTVDNEHMNKKKSKCCCVYVKPREFGESSSESEDECEHCYGHVELKKKNKPQPPAEDAADGGAEGGGPSGSGDDPPSDGNKPGDPRDSDSNVA
uniref:E3 ubiquitin-protein ligase PPP1R11 n=1 Tax=Culex pipiens TaxID=7175 RepID=A0A8D8BNE6_CULPI